MSTEAATRARWPRVDLRFWSNVAIAPGCWLWKGRTQKGYGYFEVRGRAMRAHRFSYELHFGDVPPGLGVLHTCDTPGCVRPDHLYAGTQLDNARDRDTRGRGAPPPLSRLGLTRADVQRARAMWRAGHLARDVAKHFGVERHCMSRALKGVGRYGRVRGAVALKRGGFR